MKLRRLFPSSAFVLALLLLPLSRPVLSRRAVGLIPLLLAVWANGHGSYVVAFVLLGALTDGGVPITDQPEISFDVIGYDYVDMDTPYTQVWQGQLCG